MTNEPTHPTDPNAAPTPAAAPGTAGSPPPQPPRRGGLPRWAWFLIGGGALVMIVIIVVVALVVNAVMGAVSNTDRADAPTSAPSATATAPSTGTPSPSTPPTNAAGSAGVTGLDEYVELGAPFWSFPVLDDWEITVFDQQGVNQATNAELGCLFTTSQNRQSPYDLAATNDRSDTEASLEALTQQMLDAVDEAKVVGDTGSTEVAIGIAQGEQSLEFATGRVEYVNPQNDETYVNDIAARAMPQSEAYLYLVVSCPAAVVDAGQSPFETLVDSSAVVFE
jgi:hypothetical protein